MSKTVLEITLPSGVYARQAIVAVPGRAPVSALGDPPQKWCFENQSPLCGGKDQTLDLCGQL